MQIGVLRAIGVIISVVSATVYSAIDLAHTMNSLLYPVNISLRSWLENGSLIFTSTLRDSNGSI